MVNRVTLVGNLGRDPEVRHLESGASVAKFSIATNESYKDKAGNWQDSTEWHDIILWRALADRAENQLRKGMTVYLEGKLTTRTWQDKDGNNRKTTEVVGNFFRILNKREGGGSGQINSGFPDQEMRDPMYNKDTRTDTPAAPATSAPASNDTPTVVDNANDDLPF